MARVAHFRGLQGQELKAMMINSPLKALAVNGRDEKHNHRKCWGLQVQARREVLEREAWVVGKRIDTKMGRAFSSGSAHTGLERSPEAGSVEQREEVEEGLS